MVYGCIKVRVDIKKWTSIIKSYNINNLKCSLVKYSIKAKPSNSILKMLSKHKEKYSQSPMLSSLPPPKSQSHFSSRRRMKNS